jgi:lysophospholipase L1-like esterase
MRIRTLVYLFVLLLAPVAAHPRSEPDVCALEPAMPPEVKAYQAIADAARATGRKPNPPAPEVGAAYVAWQQKLFAVDFPNACRYRAANAALPPATKRRIVFFGDSITERWTTLRPDFFAGDRVDRGIGGQTTRQMIGRFRVDVIGLDPATVHILAGINDLAGATGPTSLSEIEGNLASMAELARAHKIKVVLGAILPARTLGGRPGHDPAPDIASLNAWLRAYAAREGFGFVDYHAALDDSTGGLSLVNSADGIHPTAAGYAIMEPLAEKAFARAVR